MKIAKSFGFGFKVVKRTNGSNGKPLANMVQYYLTDQYNNYLSFWNDIPLARSGDIVNACIQIPKEKKEKFQVIKSQKYHPFMQDTKKNVFTKQLELRYYAQFPLFNYGFIPQTWEQNIQKDQQGLYVLFQWIKGDDDPIDICDLSRRTKQIGCIYRAKILGSFCLIDQGQVDWKIFLVDQEQAKHQRINDINYYPKQQIKAIMGWFKGIKIFDGKKANEIAFNQKIFSKDETIDIITQTHNQWLKLINSKQQEYKIVRQKYHFI